MSKQMSGKTILVGICLLGPSLSVLVYLTTGDLLYSSLSLACSTIVCVVLARLVLIEPGQAKLITAATIFAVGITCATTPFIFQSPLWVPAANQLIRQYYPGYEIPETAVSTGLLLLLAAIIIAATVAVVFFVLKSNAEPKGAARQPTELSNGQLGIIGRTLQVNIDNLDREFRFFDFQSPAIDPKLELLSTAARFPKTQTMVEVALSAADGEFILAKGEPGSGKSVMLRNLTRQLIAKIQNGGKIPLLLSMRDWQLAEGAEKQQMLRDFHAWARSEFGRQTGSRKSTASDDQYEQLYAEGRFIFLIDSFDENQAVSNSAHHGQFIGTLSHMLVEYVLASGGCVGITFSREYKSPSTGWIKHRTYVVRRSRTLTLRNTSARTATMLRFWWQLWGANGAISI